MVNAFLVVIWAMTGAPFFWPILVMAGWGIGVVANAYDAYGRDVPSEEPDRPRGGEAAPRPLSAVRLGRELQCRAPTSSIRSWVRAVSRMAGTVSGRAFTMALGRADHERDDQVREHPQVLGGPVGRVGQPGEVGGQLALDEVDLVPDGLADREAARPPAPGR